MLTEEPSSITMLGIFLSQTYMVIWKVPGSKDVLKTTSMHQPKVGDGISILLVAYIGSYLLFSIPSLQRCNTCKGTKIVKGTIVVLFKGTTRLAKGKTIITLG
jgi:hypothetical protein